MASDNLDVLPFVRVGEKDLFPDTPHLSINIQAAIELSLTLPYPIHFTIRRLAKGDATDKLPCIFRWDPLVDAFSPPSGLVLLRHSSRSGGGHLEPIPVDHSSCDTTISGKDGLALTRENSQFWWELAAPGSEVSLTATLPEWYYRVIIKAGGSAGVPHFTVAVGGAATVKSYEHFGVNLAFTYHGVTGADGKLETSTASPVTFHSWAFTEENDSIKSFSIHLERRSGGPEAVWEKCALWESGATGWVIYDELDIEMHVRQRGEDFTSLRPGESWATWLSLNDLLDIALPRDSMPGDVFRCWVGRCEMDWWDWGTMEEHTDTVVKLPCWVKAEVTEPRDNGERPRLVVPASE